MAKVKLFEIPNTIVLFSGNKKDKWFMIAKEPLYLTDNLENEQKEYWSNILDMKIWLPYSTLSFPLWIWKKFSL